MADCQSVCRKHKRRDEVTEQHISLLLNCGLLTRHLTQKDTYWFALAGVGPLIKSLIKGRKVSELTLFVVLAYIFETPQLLKICKNMTCLAEQFSRVHSLAEPCILVHWSDSFRNLQVLAAGSHLPI